MTTTIFLLLGLALLLAGSYCLVDAAAAIALRAKVAKYIVGISIVGIGASLPQLFIASTAAAMGLGDLAVGTVIGSNIFNLLFLIGLTAATSPFSVVRHNIVRDITVGIFVAVLLLLLCADSLFPHITQNEVGRMDAIFLLLIFAVYILLAILHSRKEEKAREENEETVSPRLLNRPAWLLWLIAAASLAAMLFGSKMLVDNTVELTLMCGITHKVAALTVLSIGSSLPLFTSCIVATRKNEPHQAVGNIISSCVINIVAVLGIAGLISPLVLTDINMLDLGMMALASVLTFVCAFTFKRHAIIRSEGIIFVSLYFIYVLYLLLFC